MKTNTNLSVFLHTRCSSLLVFVLCFLGDAGKNSSSGAISGNTGEKGDPCGRVKAEGGIHYKVTLWFKGKCSRPRNNAFTLFPFPSGAPPPCAHTSLAYYLRFVKMHFTLTGTFQAFKARFDVLVKPKQLKFYEIRDASRPLSLLSHSEHASSCATDDLS